MQLLSSSLNVLNAIFRSNECNLLGKETIEYLTGSIASDDRHKRVTEGTYYYLTLVRLKIVKYNSLQGGHFGVRTSMKPDETGISTVNGHYNADGSNSKFQCYQFSSMAANQ